MNPRARLLLVALVLIPFPPRTRAVEPADTDDGIAPYLQADGPRRGRVYKDRITPHWFADDAQFWYRNDLRNGAKEFVLVNAAAGKRGPAFDHTKLAAALSKAAGKDYTAERLPFDTISFRDGTKAVTFGLGSAEWKCDLTTYECSATGGKPPAPAPANDDNPRPRGRDFGGRGERGEREVRSPDRKWTAFVRDHNLFLRDADGKEVTLTKDGKEGSRYGMLVWSPDSKSLAAFRIEAGDDKPVYLIESSPRGGGRAVLHTRPYPLPGDKLTAFEPRLFDVAAGKEINVEAERVDLGFPRVRWAKDGRSYTYQKVDRGHGRFRLIEVDARAGKSRNLIDEKSDTFVWTAHTENVTLSPVTWLEKTDELIHVSEKSGWRHLYLIDATTGKEKNAITCGEWVVRGIERIDEEKRQVWFRASGWNPGQDPYFIHHYRINFDGSGLVPLTAGNGTHTVQFSPKRRYLIDTFHRVDAPALHELRSADDGKLVCEVDAADASELKASGWAAPEVFTAKGRDGKTDIWGIICRPRDFDPAKKCPVIEYIYAGPQGSFVPKSFSPFRRFSELTDKGFIVVQIDGMGTANRSKAFHDVCWKNLKDGGFPDRVLWHKAVAAKYPYYDTSRVGIYGGSAGGQNAAAAVLFHGEFYKAAVAGCGCHDNRMDKASWNEQWMGYPVGPHYAASSNIDNAYRLRGKLMLIVGEMDTNVPTESTYRLCDALIKAGKDFDFVFVPGAGHGMGGLYGPRRMHDFFIRHLQGVEPPDRNAPPKIDPPKPLKPADPPKKPTEPEKKEPEKKESDKKEPEKLDLAGLIAKPTARAAAVVRRFEADQGSLTRAYPVPFSTTRVDRLSKFYANWATALKDLDTEKLSADDREELAKLRAKVEGEYHDLSARASADSAALPWLPFAGTVVGLEEARRRMEPVDPVGAAVRLSELPKAVAKVRSAVAAAAAGGTVPPGLEPRKASATRAAEGVDRLRGSLAAWFRFYDGYDPLFSWWVAHPYKQADQSLADYAKFLREAAGKLSEGVKVAPFPHRPIPRSLPPSEAPDLGALMAEPPSEMIPVLRKYQGNRGGWRGRSDPGDRPPSGWLAALDGIAFDELGRDAQVDYVLFKSYLQREQKRQALRGRDGGRPLPPKDDTGIVGRPIGREAMMAELAGEMVPYTPEELIALARQELSWCDAEIRKASREMGYGDEWKKAVEKVKTLHVAPGGQPKLIRELAVEAVDYLKKHDLVTVPPLAEETWRMEMMSPERQLVSPFFTGGEVITVSFPTNTMSHDAKLQSMRGNNPHFSRATVHHELIPGHHLQQFQTAREKSHRGLFSTPFWGEGWALYWEFVLYERGFPQTPEDRVGFLVWRMHRFARVIFSLGYHLGNLTPRQCIDLLVDRVGFEPDNAAAEVRRSFSGGYGPLYQAAYLIGGMQFWSLRKELVGTGRMTERAFHDAVLRENRIPVAMVRAILTRQKLSGEAAPVWKFAAAPTALPAPAGNR